MCNPFIKQWTSNGKLPIWSKRLQGKRTKDEQ